MGINRAVTRSKQAACQNEVKGGQLILMDWEPLQIRQHQLADENIGLLLTAIETVKGHHGKACQINQQQ